MKSNEKIIAGLKLVNEGINEVISALEGVAVEAVTTAEPKTATKKMGKKTEVAKEETEAPVVEGEYSKEDLDAMKYNELKKLGASMGVSCKGTRDEITARMLEHMGVEATEEDEAPAEEETAPVKKGLNKKSAEKEDNKVVPIGKKKGLSKKTDEEPAEEEEEDIPAEYVEQAEAILEKESLKDVIAILADSDIKCGKKKSEVQKALALALFKGLIEVEDEDEEEEEVEDTAEDDGEEITTDTYFDQYDPEGINDPANMSDNRATAIHEMMEEAIGAVEDESLTEEDMTTFVEEFGTEEDLELLGDSYEFTDLFGMYCEIKKHLIDDDGVLHEGGDPYEINEDNYCCGHVLKYDKKTKTYICEVCGESYEE